MTEEILKIKALNGAIINVGDLICYEGEHYRVDAITHEKGKMRLWVYHSDESGKQLADEILVITPEESRQVLITLNGSHHGT